MKKIFALLLSAITVFSSFGVFAGDVPESLLYSDNAQVFFAQVIESYMSKGDELYVTVLPLKAVKGDVSIGKEQAIVYYNPNTVGDFKLKAGNVYLFTYFDENNPADIFEVTSYDTKSLKLKNVSGDMWERFQKYLNDGEYEKAEFERIDNKNAPLILKGTEEFQLTEFLNDTEHIKLEIKGGHRFAKQNGVYSENSDLIGRELNTKKLLKLAENITLLKSEKTQFESTSGIYLYSGDNCLFVSTDGKAGIYKDGADSPMYGEYIIKAQDIAEILSALPPESESFPPLEKPLNTAAYDLIIISVLLVIAGICMVFVLKRKKDK